MALSPLKSPSERAEQITKVIGPSRTYAYDLETGEVGGTVDGADAIRQFVRKAIATARYRFPIYNGQYGCEIDTLIGQDVPMALLQTEIPRLFREALIYDDRVKDIRDFTVARSGDELYVTFTVDTVEGVIVEEVTV